MATAVDAGGALETDEDTAPAAEGSDGGALAINLGMEDAGPAIASDAVPAGALLELEPVREMEFAVKPQVLKAGLAPSSRRSRGRLRSPFSATC